MSGYFCLFCSLILFLFFTVFDINDSTSISTHYHGLSTHRNIINTTNTSTSTRKLKMEERASVQILPAVTSVSQLDLSEARTTRHRKTSSIDTGRTLAHHKMSSRKRRRRHYSLSYRVKRFILRYTWAFPLAAISAFIFVYSLNPSESNPVHKFLFPSYPVGPETPGGPIKYAKGRDDFAFVFFYIIFFSFTREFVMQEVLRPLARYWGLASRGKQTRFMEQAYAIVYFIFIAPLGLYIMKGTPVWFFNTRGMYEDFPHKTLTGDLKFYYLFQAAYWAQQAIVLVLGMEKPRKDANEMILHHIVTLSLIGLSYRFHFTHIGIAVYITHDISDLFLAVSKVLNYLKSPITVPFYATFMGVWIYMRHYINLRIIYSLFTEYKTVGPYELNWDTEQYKCPLAQAITSTLLIALQSLNLVWLYYVLRVAYRITFYNEQRDARSDDEASDAEVEKPTEKAKAN